MASWTEDDIELLKKLTLEGYSASQIADRMRGRTRNSVISRWHREGLEVGKQPKKRKPRTSSLPQDTSGIEPLNVELLDLHEQSCRWATTTQLPHLFCGHPKQEGSSYCSAHHAIAYRPVQSRRDQRPEPRRKAA